MNVEEIKNTLDLAQCELRAAYKRLGYLNSNVLNSIDKCLADLSNQNNNTLVKADVMLSFCDCDTPNTKIYLKYRKRHRMCLDCGKEIAK